MGNTKMGFKKIMIFIILSATVAIAYQIPYLRYTFYDQMAAALQLNDTQMGLLATAVSLTSTCCYPIGGIFAEKFSCRNLIMISLAGLIGCTVVYSFTTNFVLIMIIHILYGFFSIATLWSAYLVGLRSLGDESVQSTLFGSSEATRGVVQTVCAFIYLGVIGLAASQATGFRYVLYVGIAICVLILILAFIFLPKGNLNGAVEENTKKYTIMETLKCKGVWIACLLIMCAYVSWSCGNGYLTTYTVRVLGVSEATASTLGIIRSYIIVFLAGFLGGWLVDRFKFKGKAFTILFICIIITMGAVMFTNTMVTVCIVITMILAFVANIMKSTYWSTLGQAGIPLNMTAAATGIISFIAFIPDFIITAVAGKWLDNATQAGNVAAGFNKIFILLFIFSGIGIVGSLILTRQAKSLEAREAENN